MSDYIIHNGTLMSEELYHYGVKGMKWGKRKALRYEDKAKTARASAREWDEIRRSKVAKYQAAGKDKKAAKAETKYKALARNDISDAQKYEAKAAKLNPHKKKKSPTQKVSSGKKTAKKTVAKTGKKKVADISRKTVSIGAQMAIRAAQNQLVYRSSGRIIGGMVGL